MPYERSPTQRSGCRPSRPAPKRRARVDGDHDHHGGDERNQREAAPEEEGLVLVEPEAEPDEPTKRGEAHDIEQQRGDASHPVPEPSRYPHEGERGPEEETGSPGIGPVVDARGIYVGPVKNSHQQCRTYRAHEHDGQRAAPKEHRPSDEQQRPQHVELLLDSQRPQVLQQKWPPDGLKVRFLPDDEVPVGHVPERRERVLAQSCDLAGQEHDGERECDHEQQVQRGEQPAGASHPEAHEVYAALPTPLLQ